MTVYLVVGAMVWVLAELLIVLATKKQMDANPRQRIPHFYSREHVDPDQARLFRSGGAGLLFLSGLLLFQGWSFYAIIPMAVGFLPAILLTMQHNHSLRSRVV